MHILIIPDGNRRWAKKKLLNPSLGHKEGKKTLVSLAESMINNNIDYLTFWVLSKDNFVKRSDKEISFLVDLLKEGFSEMEENEFIIQNDIKISIIGDYKEVISKNIVDKLDQINIDNKDKKGPVISFLFCYNGDEETVCAVKKLVENNEVVNKENVVKNLWSSMLPDVDILIRTGCDNDPHLSGNVLMWQTAYSQLVFSEKMFPDFSVMDLENSIKEVEKREKRKGA